MARLGKRQRALLEYAADGKLQLYRGWQGANDVHSPDDEARFREQEVERLADLDLVDFEPGTHFLSQNVVLIDAGRAALAADRSGAQTGAGPHSDHKAGSPDPAASNRN